MNDLPLKPLVWKDYGNGTASETRSALHEYDAWQTDDDTGWYVSYFDRRNPTGIKEATGFATIEDTKTWAWNHYNEKMQPYVKPMPTWVDVNEREPTEKGDYLIRDYQGRVAMGKYDKGFYMESGGEKWGCVQFWMPTPEFSAMQNNKGE